jgi:hypothetical protein
MGSKPKAPKPAAPQAQLVDLGAETSEGSSNFEAELKKRQKQAKTSFAGETGGYGGKTTLG